MLGFHPIRALVPVGLSGRVLSSSGNLAAVGQCAKSVILPHDFMGSSGSSPLPAAGLSPAPNPSASPKTSGVSPAAIGVVAVLVGLAYWFWKGS